MSTTELLTTMLDVFPNEGYTVPYIELKFRYAGRFGPDLLDSVLKQLVDDGVLMTYEFNGSLNYKSLKDLPLTSNSRGTPIKEDDMHGDLVKILKELAIRTTDPELLDMVNEFARKYT